MGHRGAAGWSSSSVDGVTVGVPYTMRCEHYPCGYDSCLQRRRLPLLHLIARTSPPFVIEIPTTRVRLLPSGLLVAPRAAAIIAICVEKYRSGRIYLPRKYIPATCEFPLRSKLHDRPLFPITSRCLH